jgi:YVTN family beta-propeller protein
MIDAAGAPLATIDVGEGPTGLCLDEPRGRLYVLNKFDATISVIDTTTLSERARVSMFDPTPAAIRDGRPLLYDARLTSGLGVTACASCHVDARMDQIAWDLGDPSGPLKPFNQHCDDLLGAESGTSCEDFHPLKGPMVTQTLQGSIGREPFHWRGDREDLAAFNPAFVGLLGNDRMLTDEEMNRFAAFLATITFPPNPNRNPDDSLRPVVSTGDGGFGDAIRGRELFMFEPIDTGAAIADESNVLLDAALETAGPILSCNRCHQIPDGTNRRITSARNLATPQGMKVPHLRNMHEKTGVSFTSRANNRGFGFTHDGHLDTVDHFLRLQNFDFGPGSEGDRRRRDVVAFVMSFGTDVHAAVGMQVTLDGSNNDDPQVAATIDLMLRLADGGDVGVVVKGVRDGRPQGFAYLGGGEFQSDRAGETLAGEALRRVDPAAGGGALTWTVVPLGSQTRIGIDRDEDGVLDGDEAP